MGCAKKEERERKWRWGRVTKWRSRVGGGGERDGGECQGSQGRMKLPRCQDSDACLSFRASVTQFRGFHAGGVFAQKSIYTHAFVKKILFLHPLALAEGKKSPDSSSVTFSRDFMRVSQ